MRKLSKKKEKIYKGLNRQRLDNRKHIKALEEKRNLLLAEIYETEEKTFELNKKINKLLGVA